MRASLPEPHRGSDLSSHQPQGSSPLPFMSSPPLLPSPLLPPPLSPNLQTLASAHCGSSLPKAAAWFIQPPPHQRRKTWLSGSVTKHFNSNNHLQPPSTAPSPVPLVMPPLLSPMHFSSDAIAVKDYYFGCSPPPRASYYFSSLSTQGSWANAYTSMLSNVEDLAHFISFGRYIWQRILAPPPLATLRSCADECFKSPAYHHSIYRIEV